MMKTRTIENVTVSNHFVPSRKELSSKYKNRNSNKIAKEYGVTGRTVRNWLEKYEIARRVQKPSKEELSAKCETKTLSEIAGEYDVCRSTIKNWKKDYGITTRKERPKKIPKKNLADPGARKARTEYSQKTRQTRHKDLENRAGENYAEENGEAESPQTNKVTFDFLVNSYNELFGGDKNAILKDIFKNIITKTGRERIMYMALRNHYNGLERASA